MARWETRAGAFDRRKSGDCAGMEPVDFFALLDLPRNAHVDEALLRDRYHERVRVLIDPTTGGGEEGRMLHQVYEVLADPVQRLRHLLQLAAPGRQGGGAALSGDLLEIFPKVGAALSRADGLLGRLLQTSSALGRAVLAVEEAEAQMTLQNVLATLSAKWDEETSRLPQVAATDPEALESALGRLRVIQKWKAEVQARLLKFLAA